MNARVLLDTDIVIDYLRSRAPAIAFVRGLSVRPAVSVITIAELYSGVREGAERKSLDAISIAFRVIPLSRDIAVRGGIHRRQFRASHGVQLSDALIAATAESIDAQLFTFNTKHYPMLANVTAPYSKA